MRKKYMVSAVTCALSGHFGDSLPVLNETPFQNAPKEFLFVHLLNMNQEPDNGRFHNRIYFFDIRYHPDDKQYSQNGRVQEVIEGLLECLVYIETDDQPVKASSIRTEMQDGVLHCFVDYPVRVMLPEPEDPVMQTIKITESVKE